jgi:hypothetical protein
VNWYQFESLPVWVGSGGITGPAYTTATPEGTNSCFDNGNIPGAVQQYSIGTTAAHGNNPNCALSFRFQ